MIPNQRCSETFLARPRDWREADRSDSSIIRPHTHVSAFLQAFNDALEIRRLTVGLAKPQRQAIAAALPKELAAA